MPGEKFGKNKPYIYVVDGVLNQSVTATTDGAIRRDYELKNGKKGTKYEIPYKSWTGLVQDLIIKDGEYGEMLEVEFKDAIVTFHTDSKYFSSFAQKLANVDINRAITISPYSFESNGKPLKGVTIYQDGEKVKNYYWDDVVGTFTNGYPKPHGDTSKFKKDDWTVYYLGVKKFLIKELDDVRDQIKKEEIAEPVDVPEIEEQPEIAEAEEVTVGGEKIPF